MKIKFSLLNSHRVRYLPAIATIFAVLLLDQALGKIIGGQLPHYITPYQAVMLVALMAGFWPGSLAALSAVLLAVYWILPPCGSLYMSSSAAVASLVVFILNCFFLGGIAEFYRRSRLGEAVYKAELALCYEHNKGEETLTESKERLRLAFENASIGI